MRMRTGIAVALTALLTSGCGLFGIGKPREPAKLGPEAVLEDLGSRIHEGAELIQLEDTWVQLNPHPRGFRVPISVQRSPWERLPPAAKTDFCRYNLELAELLRGRYAKDRYQRVAHALETYWRFELPQFAFCRKDPAVASALDAHVKAAIAQVNEDVVIYAAEWAEAKDESLVLIFGGISRHDADQTLHFSQGEVTGQSTTFEGFKVKERLGQYEIEADYRTRDVVEDRPDRWARLDLGLPWEETKRLLRQRSGGGYALVVPKGTTELERTTGTYDALDGDALAYARQSTGEWAWVSWSTRELPPGFSVTHRGDAATVEPATEPVAPPTPTVEPAPEPKVEPAPEPKVEPAPEPKVEPAPEPKVDPPPVPAPTPAPVVETSGGETYISPLVWTGFGAGGAFLIVGGITGGLAASQASDLKDRCGTGSDCGGAITQSELDSATTVAHVSTASFALGGAGIAVGIIGLFLSDFDGTPDGADAAFEPLLGPGFVGARGSF